LNELPILLEKEEKVLEKRTFERRLIVPKYEN